MKPASLHHSQPQILGVTPATAIFREAPANLRESERHLFQKAEHHVVPQRHIERYTDVHVYGRGPLWCDGQFLKQSFAADSLHAGWMKSSERWRTALERTFQPARKFDEPAIWITDNWSCGYFHWICDTLPRLENALTHFDASELTLLLPTKFKRHSYMAESLRAFGLRNVRFLNRFEHLRCSNLLLPTRIDTTGNYAPEIMERLRSRFQNQLGSTQLARSPRLYVSRQAATRRRIANERELAKVFEKFGFQTVVAEDRPWSEQFQLVAQADFLVSNHGAGLANILGMQPGSRVMEIRDDQEDHLNCYYSLADSMGVQYHYLLAGREDPSLSSHKANMIVDPVALESALERMTEGGDRLVTDEDRLQKRIA